MDFVLTVFKHWTLQKLGSHGTQVVPDPKPAMGDSVLVTVIVVSEPQGENHFSLNEKPVDQSDRARVTKSGDREERLLSISILQVLWLKMLGQPYHRKWSVQS